MSDEAQYRLPRTALPRRYDLTLEPDLDGATFIGAEDVELEVRERTGEIVLNAADLEIAEGWLARGEDRIAVSDVRLDEEQERAHLELERDVEPG